MDLDSGSVRGEQLQRHSPFLPDQDGLGAVGGQRGLDGVLVRFVGVLCHNQQPPRGLACFHAARALPSAGEEVCAELTAEAQIAVDVDDVWSALTDSSRLARWLGIRM